MGKFQKTLSDWFNVLGDLHLNLSISLSSHECITSRTLMQAFFNLIVANQIHYHLTFALITLLSRS